MASPGGDRGWSQGARRFLQDMRIAVEYWEDHGAQIPEGWGTKASVTGTGAWARCLACAKQLTDRVYMLQLKKMSRYIRDPKFKQYDEVRLALWIKLAG